MTGTGSYFTLRLQEQEVTLPCFWWPVKRVCHRGWCEVIVVLLILLLLLFKTMVLYIVPHLDQVWMLRTWPDGPWRPSDPVLSTTHPSTTPTESQEVRPFFSTAGGKGLCIIPLWEEKRTKNKKNPIQFRAKTSAAHPGSLETGQFEGLPQKCGRRQKGHR